MSYVKYNVWNTNVLRIKLSIVVFNHRYLAEIHCKIKTQKDIQRIPLIHGINLNNEKCPHFRLGDDNNIEYEYSPNDDKMRG